MKSYKGILIWPLAMLCILLFTGKTLATPTVSLELSSIDISVGDTFDLYVIADGVIDIDPFWGADAILSFGFDVDYTPSEFTYNGATVGTSFYDDSMLLPNTDVAGSVFPGVSGDGILLADLSFTALMEGSFWLGITSDLTDFNEGLNSWLYGPLDMTNNININVSPATSPAPVPEPATILMVASGLAGLTGYRRKIKS